MLLAAREELGINQKDAAERCGVSFSAYEKWERGAPIKAPVIAGLLLMLGVPASAAIDAAKKIMQKKK